MRFTRLLVLLVVGGPAISYAQEPERPTNGEDYAEEYASQGTLEVGGAIGASVTENVATVTASPTVGYFIVDRIEISGTFTLAYSRTEDEDTGQSMSNTAGALIVEPSYHHPISDDLLLAGGLGVGVGYDGDNYDFQVLPSVGVDIVTTRSNVITPSVRVPILVGESHGDNGDTGVAIGLALDIAVTTTW